MKRKYKVTPFTRFLIFLIFFTPLAYIGASYYNGENGIEKIKSLLQIETSKSKIISDKEQKIALLRKDITKLQDEITELKKSD